MTSRCRAPLIRWSDDNTLQKFRWLDQRAALRNDLSPVPSGVFPRSAPVPTVCSALSQRPHIPLAHAARLPVFIGLISGGNANQGDTAAFASGQLPPLGPRWGAVLGVTPAPRPPCPPTPSHPDGPRIGRTYSSARSPPALSVRLGPCSALGRRGAGQVPADAAPEHLQGCLQTTSNSGTEARTQESFPPPSPSLPTLLLGLICTDLPRRLLSDLPWPWQSCGQGGGAAGGWCGAACRGWGGRWGEGQANRRPACQKQFRPRNSFNARRRSRLGAKPAGLEENVLGRQRGTPVWGWLLTPALTPVGWRGQPWVQKFPSRHHLLPSTHGGQGARLALCGINHLPAAARALMPRAPYLQRCEMTPLRSALGPLVLGQPCHHPRP